MDDDNCPICYDELVDDNRLIIIPCNHSFCKDCLSQHMTSTVNTSCPLDRREVESIKNKDLCVSLSSRDTSIVLFELFNEWTPKSMNDVQVWLKLTRSIIRRLQACYKISKEFIELHISEIDAKAILEQRCLSKELLSKEVDTVNDELEMLYAFPDSELICELYTSMAECKTYFTRYESKNAKINVMFATYCIRLISQMNKLESSFEASVEFYKNLLTLPGNIFDIEETKLRIEVVNKRLIIINKLLSNISIGFTDINERYLRCKGCEWSCMLCDRRNTGEIVSFTNCKHILCSICINRSFMNDSSCLFCQNESKEPVTECISQTINVLTDTLETIIQSEVRIKSELLSYHNDDKVSSSLENLIISIKYNLFSLLSDNIRHVHRRSLCGCPSCSDPSNKSAEFNMIVDTSILDFLESYMSFLDRFILNLCSPKDFVNDLMNFKESCLEYVQIKKFDFTCCIINASDLSGVKERLLRAVKAL